MMSVSSMTLIERALYSLSKRKVRITCSNLQGELVGEIDKFWIDGFYKDRINFCIDLGDKKLTYGIDKPDSFEDKGDSFLFKTKRGDFLFEKL